MRIYHGLHTDGRVTVPPTEAGRRTDGNMRQRKCEEQHTWRVCQLISTVVDVIANFPPGCVHSINLGVTEKTFKSSWRLAAWSILSIATPYSLSSAIARCKIIPSISRIFWPTASMYDIRFAFISICRQHYCMITPCSSLTNHLGARLACIVSTAGQFWYFRIKLDRAQSRTKSESMAHTTKRSFRRPTQKMYYPQSYVQLVSDLVKQYVLYGQTHSSHHP